MKQTYRIFWGVAATVGICLLTALGHAEPVDTAAHPITVNGAGEITLGEPLHHENLTLYPLISSNASAGRYYTPLDKAMDKGKLRIKELASANVPTLSVENTGKDEVFIMTGEIVTGAKQDRMSASDVILPPTAKAVALSVYCVEQGRWQQRTHQFAAGRTAGTTMLRKTAAKRGEQGVIWSKVARKSRDAAVRSDTGTMQAVYDNRQIKRRITVYEKALSALGGRDDVVGFIAAVDGLVVSADLFANNGLMRALSGKLLKAMALDAVTSKSPSSVYPDIEAVRAFFTAGINGARKPTENPGLGTSSLIEAENDITGTELIHDGRIVHLSVFGPDREDHPRILPGNGTPHHHEVEQRRAPSASQDKTGSESNASTDTPRRGTEKSPNPQKKMKLGKKASSKRGMD